MGFLIGETASDSVTSAPIKFFPFSKSSTGCSGFVWNPVRINGLCYTAKFDVLDSTAQPKFSYEIVSTKRGSDSQRLFLTKFHKGLEMSPEA